MVAIHTSDSCISNHNHDSDHHAASPKLIWGLINCKRFFGGTINLYNNFVARSVALCKNRNLQFYPRTLVERKFFYEFW